MDTPTSAIGALDDSIDKLEKLLEPFLSGTLDEALSGYNTLEQAKICTMLPYIVDELITVYLRSKGHDSTQHPVHAEQERIKKYFHKVYTAEGAKETELPSQQRSQLDKDAANRFIMAALSEAAREEKKELERLGVDPSKVASHSIWKPREREGEEQPQMDGGMHTRFSHVQEIIEEPEIPSSSDSEVGSNRLKSQSVEAKGSTSGKRKRPVPGPLAGVVIP
ncbi:hypothetical protein CPB86DRAFT_702515 [Serendipita vermifera]|nr:hypothetical protein CPB86DRAFT_702515 [Serendipita vermifera]